MSKASTSKEGGRERNLERRQVVTEALALLDEVGYAGLTLRKLADRLHVKAAALYWHFENKQDLIDAMAEHMILGSFSNSVPPSEDWRDLFGWMARTNYQALMSHRDGAQILAHANMRQTSMLDGLESLMQVLSKQQFSPELAMQSFFIIIRYTLGCVFEEQADPTRHAQKTAEREHQLRKTADRYPYITKSFLTVIKKHHNRPNYMFEQGLAIILDGIGAHLAASGATS